MELTRLLPSPYIFHLAVNRFGFDYPVFDKDKSDGGDVDVSDKDDETNLENDDEENVETVPPAAETTNRQRERERNILSLSNHEEVQDYLSKVMKTCPNKNLYFFV